MRDRIVAMLAETANQLAPFAVGVAIGFVLVISSFLGGFATGVWAGPGASTAAAQSYAKGLQAQWEADIERRVGTERLACVQERTALQEQLEDERQVYSERILGLQRQLVVRGVSERIILPAELETR